MPRRTIGDPTYVAPVRQGEPLTPGLRARYTGVPWQGDPLDLEAVVPDHEGQPADLESLRFEIIDPDGEVKWTEAERTERAGLWTGGPIALHKTGRWRIIPHTIPLTPGLAPLTITVRG